MQNLTCNGDLINFIISIFIYLYIEYMLCYISQLTSFYMTDFKILDGSEMSIECEITREANIYVHTHRLHTGFVSLHLVIQGYCGLQSI